jgi:hypothetical protein
MRSTASVFTSTFLLVAIIQLRRNVIAYFAATWGLTSSGGAPVARYSRKQSSSPMRRVV